MANAHQSPKYPQMRENRSRRIQALRAENDRRDVGRPSSCMLQCIAIAISSSCTGFPIKYFHVFPQYICSLYFCHRFSSFYGHFVKYVNLYRRRILKSFSRCADSPFFLSIPFPSILSFFSPSIFLSFFYFYLFPGHG